MFTYRGRSNLYIIDFIVLMNKGIYRNTIVFCQLITLINIRISFSLFPFRIGLSGNSYHFCDLFLRQPFDIMKF